MRSFTDSSQLLLRVEKSIERTEPASATFFVTQS